MIMHMYRDFLTNVEFSGLYAVPSRDCKTYVCVVVSKVLNMKMWIVIQSLLKARRRVSL
jgi:hypothetical protein